MSPHMDTQTTTSKLRKGLISVRDWEYQEHDHASVSVTYIKQYLNNV